MNSSRRRLESVPPPWDSVLDSSYNGIIIVNREGFIIFYNQAAERIFNSGDNSPVGSHFSEYRPQTWPDIKNIIDTGVPQIGFKLTLPQTTIVANRNPIIIDDDIVGVISLFQDISEYEALISELQGYQKLHRELEAIFESSNDGLYITDGKANTIRVNRAYEKITGLSRRDLIGRNMRDLVNEKVFDHSVTLEVLQNKSQVTLMQNIKSDKQVLVTGTPIFDEDKQIALVVTNVRDMTLLNKLSSELQESRRLSFFYKKSLQEKEKLEHALQDMVVRSSAMNQVVSKAVKVADVDTSVFISGESGVGKSMLARLIHLMSPRKEHPFIKINCSTIPESLMESELYGYEKGAFTGADPAGKTGLMEMAHTGTVFLDEIGDLTPNMQVKLLQVIEEKTFTKVGGRRLSTVDARVIAATNRDLRDMMKRGEFREDLYYRLNVIPIHIPPLRHRPEDVPPLAMRTLEKFNRSKGYNKKIKPEVLDELMRYDYPGNVRELINILERMIIMSEGDTISAGDLPREIKTPSEIRDVPIQGGLSLKEATAQFEASYIQAALSKHATLQMTAKMLKIHPTTLWRKMVRLGLQT